MAGIKKINFSFTYKARVKKDKEINMYFNYLEKADPEITASIKREINRLRLGSNSKQNRTLT